MPTELDYFKRTAALACEAMARGDDGFACVLVDEQGEIILEQGNLAQTEKDPTAHDAILLARRAVKAYTPDKLKSCTLYALVEPCVMCMGSIFWTGIGKVRYAMSEEELEAILPGGLAIHSKEFAQRSPKVISVEGGYPAISQAIGAVEIVRKWVRSLGIPGLPK